MKNLFEYLVSAIFAIFVIVMVYSYFLRPLLEVGANTFAPFAK